MWSCASAGRDGGQWVAGSGRFAGRGRRGSAACIGMDGGCGSELAHNIMILYADHILSMFSARLVLGVRLCVGAVHGVRCDALCARPSGVCVMGGIITGWRGKTAQAGLQSVTRASPACTAIRNAQGATLGRAPRAALIARRAAPGREPGRLLRRGSPRGAHVCGRSARGVPEGDMRRRFRAGLAPSPPAQQKAPLCLQAEHRRIPQKCAALALTYRTNW